VKNPVFQVAVKNVSFFKGTVNRLWATASGVHGLFMVTGSYVISIRPPQGWSGAFQMAVGLRSGPPKKDSPEVNSR